MKRDIYLDCSQEQVRAAVVEDGVLCEFHAERIGVKKLTETIFLGRVEQIRSSVGAAFVDIGQQLNAFLPLEENEKLRCGDMIIVQGAAKQATQSKGLRITSRINLAGKWLVLIPGEEGVHISKKVKDSALREELLEMASRIRPEGFGLIVRTASGEVTSEAMEEEAARLAGQWQEIKLYASGRRMPGIINESLPLDLRLVRDMGSRELNGILTNDASCFERLKKEKDEGRLSQEVSVALYEEKQQLLFDVFGIEPQIEKALKKRVWLPCGGYLIIDLCEAMTVIDVNSGKMTLGKDTEDTALRVNLEAADEIARQLRLRDVGGIIVVDFIDMFDAQHRGAVIERMKAAVKADRTPVKVEGITKLGLLEMTRKRVNDSLHHALQCSCTYCGGSGMLVSPVQTAQRAMRQLRRMSLAGQRGPFIVRCAPAAAGELLALNSPIDAPVYVAAAASKHAERFEIEQTGENDGVPKNAEIMKKGSTE